MGQMGSALFIPVILGTVRQGRVSEVVARWVERRLMEHLDVETLLIDLRILGLADDDAGESIRHPEFSAWMDRADGLVIVSPEYNHGYPGILKHALDSNYPEYMHKAVGVVGVSNGLIGGARMIENLLPVLRAVGLLPIAKDVTVPEATTAFDEAGNPVHPRLERRLAGFFTELIWMADTLRYGRLHHPEMPG
jgi:NAD(P)H-dependent FMN reductase